MQTATASYTPSQEICSQVEAYLWQERERIYAEIHAYPPPIPACDAQFNYLVEKRAIVTQELSRIRALQNREEEKERLAEWVATSQILNRKAKEEILSALEHPTHPMEKSR